jgi:RimJ/RimL family protein N-acetyltransferase
MSKSIIETERLFLRELSVGEDADFILELVNEPAWIRNIGDRGIRTTEAAQDYITNRIAPSYEQNGFGLYLVGLKNTGERVGICGLIKRDTLEDVDIGFAFLERFWSKGYAFESADAVINHARGSLGLKRIVAITIPSNQGSIKVLEKIGLHFEKMVQMPNEEEKIMLFASDAD